jgi:putative glycerol-1-phosphate prenyltransferase
VGYILVDGGRPSSVQQATLSEPLTKTDDILDTTIAAGLLGFQSVYLEAGSGAKRPVPVQTVQQVRHTIRIPLIVGGGIRTTGQMQDAFAAGADIAVIGNHFESHPEQIPLFCHAINR